MTNVTQTRNLPADQHSIHRSWCAWGPAHLAYTESHDAMSVTHLVKTNDAAICIKLLGLSLHKRQKVDLQRKARLNAESPLIRLQTYRIFSSCDTPSFRPSHGIRARQPITRSWSILWMVVEILIAYRMTAQGRFVASRLIIRFRRHGGRIQPLAESAWLSLPLNHTRHI